MDTDLDQIRNVLFLVALSMARMAAVFQVAPFMGGTILHGTVRNSIILALMLILYPIVAPTVSGTDAITTVRFVLLIAKEVALGMVIGFFVSLIFWVAEAVGFFIDNQRGSAMAQTVDPLSGATSSPMGSLFFQTLTVLFYTTGGFLAFLLVLLQSYAAWPITTFIPDFANPAFALYLLQQADMFMSYTVILAAPVIVLCFLTDLGLGLINRFTPQLNVFFLAMPIKSGLAVFVIIVYFSILFSVLRDRSLGMDLVFDSLHRFL